MLRFEQGDGEMTNSRENMVVHTGKQTYGIVSRPFLTGSAFMPLQRYGFKTFIRRTGNPFVGSLLSGVDFQGQKFTDAFALQPGIGKRNLGIWA